MPRGPGVIALLTDFCLRAPYAGLMKAAPIARAGSTGHLEISNSQGNARRRLGARIGDPVHVRHDS